MPPPRPARLHLLTTRTLPLILDRNRLLSAHPPQPVPPSLASQIDANLLQLREGILDLERDGRGAETKELREGWARIKSLLGKDWDGEELPPFGAERPNVVAQQLLPTGTGPSLGGDLSNRDRQRERDFAVPFRDSPPPSPTFSPTTELQTQYQIMDTQDAHLDQLSSSLRVQHDIGLQIGSELDLHTGLLEELDHDVDRTGGRLATARRRLETIAKGAKNNFSAWSIALLIFVLLILIIVFKT